MASVQDREVDEAVVQFLAYLEKNNAAAMAIYGFMSADGPVLRVKSNQPEGPTAGIMKILAGTDEASVTVAAKAMAERMGEVWEELSQEDQDRTKEMAHVALEAARSRLQETTKVSGGAGEPAKKIVTTPV